ncbi:MAG TPA: serine--tRNA ligase [Candidatus Saccharimonadales bacterium]
MLDIRFIRENAELVEQKAKQKGFEVDVPGVLNKDKSRREKLDEIQKLQKERNELSNSIKGRPPTHEETEKGRALKERIAPLEKNLNTIEEEFQKSFQEIPNIFPDDTPLGDEEASREERKWGDTPDKGFEVVDHVTWAEQRGLLDFERGAKIAGSKFYFTTGALVQLELALTQWAMDFVAKQNFLPMLVPHLVNSRVIDGTGFKARTKEEEQIYKVEGQDLNLIATAEIPLTAFHADEILAEKDLPKLYAGYSPAYRKEAGAYGKHSKGLYRVHQFNKVELYVFCKPEDSEHWHQKMVELEEKLCQQLSIPYRVVRIAAGDLGAAAYKKYDIEYWSPLDKSYRELTSCSNVTDYQARRLNIRYRKASGGTNYVHTLNGTAAATSRLMIAIIENYQTEGGKVSVPVALRPYMGGQLSI